MEWKDALIELPAYQRQMPGEAYSDFSTSTRNDYLCVVLNRTRGTRIQVCFFGSKGWYGHDTTGSGTKHWREIITHWMVLPELPTLYDEWIVMSEIMVPNA